MEKAAFLRTFLAILLCYFSFDKIKEERSDKEFFCSIGLKPFVRIFLLVRIKPF